ncbi:hypothetical protein ACHAWF_000895 [Thalassiosira exigua]
MGNRRALQRSHFFLYYDQNQRAQLHRNTYLSKADESLSLYHGELGTPPGCNERNDLRRAQAMSSAKYKNEGLP